MREVNFGGQMVGGNNPVFIIGEIGINHNGKINTAKLLIDIAVEAGCNAIKFQKRTIDVVYSKEELDKPREVPANIIHNAIARGVLPSESVERLNQDINNTTNGDLKYALEFSIEEYKDLFKYCEGRGILCFASCWDEKSVDDIDQFNPPCYKIGSASMTDSGLLRHTRSKGKPIILSTGLSTMEQVHEAVRIVGTDNLVILHCVSTYPTKDEDLNLSMIQTLKREFPDVPIGYSGHEHGTTMSVCAAALGAVCVERHITLDRTMWGSDQSASLEPSGLKLMAGNIQRYRKAFGDGYKKVLDDELPIIKKLRRKVDF